MDLRLEMVHLQLTRQCNLNCWFCGQRKNSVLRDGKESMALKSEEWLKVVTALDAVSECHVAIKPSVMLWGGEPLMSPCFDETAQALHERGYRIGMVTNGTLLDRHAEIVSGCLNKIYVSIDGPETLHDSIRGKGTFQKIKDNLRLIRRAAPHIPIVCMAVLTEALKEQLTAFFEALSDFSIDEVLLQDMIWLSEEEITEYRNMMSQVFSADAMAVNAWKLEEDESTGVGRTKTVTSKSVTENAAEEKTMAAEFAAAETGGKYPFSVRYLPHVHSGEMKRPCLSPYRHLHIMWNGETSFCTDFTDFSLGNVREQQLWELFKGEKAQKFRKLVENGCNPTCRHCSWGDKQDFYEL